MNRAERRAQMRERNRASYRDRRGGTPWPPPRKLGAMGRPRSAAPTIASLHIEELVLHGFPAQGRHAVGDAAQAELVRLLNTKLPEFVKTSSDAIDGGTFNVTPQTKPAHIGKLIANAVYGGRGR